MKRIILALSALFTFSSFSAAEQKIVNIGLSAASIAYSTGSIRSVSLGGYSAIPGGNTIAGMGFSYTVPTDKIAPITAISFEGSSFGIGSVYISSRTKIFLSASDAVFIDGDNLGTVLAINYSVDSDTFSAYSGSFTIASDGAHMLRYYSVDQAGNIEATRTSTITVDNISPVALVDIAGISYSSASVTYIPTASKVELKASDIVSGVKELYYELNGSSYVIAGDSATLELAEGVHILGYGAMDNLGNASGLRTMAITVDATMPLSVFDVAGSSLVIDGKLYLIAGSSLVLSATDAFSGVKEIYYNLDGSTAAAAFPLSLPGEVGAHTLAFYSTDNVGNAEAEKSMNFYIDVEMPVTTVAVAGLAGSNGWLVSPAEVTLISTDTRAGVSAVYYSLDASPYTLYTSSFTVPSEGSHTVKYYARDGVGNTELEKSVSLHIDLSTPVVSVTATPVANMFGWNNASVVVIFSGTDAVSGIAYCTHATTMSNEGSNQTITGYCRDYAGLSSTAALTIDIDKTAPVSTAVLSGTLVNGWYNTTVAITLGSIDPRSGVDRTNYRLERAGVLVSSGVYTAPVGANADGLYTVYYYSTDKAGNIEAEKSTAFQVDRTRPQVSYTLLPAANGSTWNNTAVQVIFSGTDTLSGVMECSSKTIPTEGQAQAAAGWCRDTAGNIGYSTATINIDRTPPVITISSPAAGDYFVATKNKIIISFTATDNLDDAPKAAAMLKQVEDRGSPRGARPAVIAVVAGQQIEPLDIDDGIWRLTANATDFADNISSATGGLFDVIHDVLPPRTALATGAGAGSYHSSGQDLYVTSRTTFTITSIDDLVAVADESGLGVKKQGIRVSAVGIGLPRDLVFENTNPVQGAAFTSAFKLDQEIDGAYSLAYNSEDILENLEKIKISTFIVDNIAPQTVLNRVSGPAYLTYVSTWTLFELSPSDPGAFASGVKETSYSIDSGGIATTPLKFILPGANGNYLVKYRSSDNVENLEVEKSSQVFVDAAPPFSTLSVIGGKQYPGADPDSFYTSLATKSGFMAVDPVVAGGAAGVKAIEYADNGGISTMYTQPISLGEGKHLVTYRATDRVENIEVFRSTQIYIDNTAPVTSFNITGPLYLKDGIRHITMESGLVFTSTDPLVSEVSAGVERTETAVDGGQWLKYTQALKFAEGRHTIKYRAIDNVGNMEAERVLEVRSDATPPVTGHQIGVPSHVSVAGVNYITPETPLTFSANDPVVSEVASGVERIETAVDGGAYASYTIALKFPEGRHTIKYRAYDNVGNLEAAQTLEVQSDSTAPESRWLPASGPWIEKDNKFYLNTRGSIALESADPVRNSVASGLENIYYAIDAAPAVKYLAAFSLAEGVRMVNYSAKDNVANTEVVKSTVVYVDGTKPVTSLSLSGDQYNGDKQYISQRTDIIITAEDPVINNVAVGVKNTKYSVDGAAFANYSFFKLSAEGRRLVSYYSTDFVANIETVKTTALWVDNTPPETELSIAGARYIAPGDEKLYLTRGSGIVLTSSDSVSNDTVSGVMLTKYRINNGNWLVYSGSFTIATEGLHTLEYYALDRVQNAEALKSAKIAVDNTPPVAGISLGEPKSEVFGLPVLMQNTQITLAAADPVMNSVSAGLNSIFYEFENVQTGVRAPVVAYTSPFTITEQGTFIIRYWSKDNTGNTETPKEKMAAVTTWRADGLIAASGLDMSGTADISGSVKSNAIVSLGGNARILGDVTASTITLTGKAQITGLQISGAVPVNPAPIYLAGIVQNAAAVNNNALVSAYLVDGKLALSSKLNITLSTGTYYFKGMDISGGSSITISGKVDILVEGGITINGGSSLNASGQASMLSIIVSTASELKFNGGGALAACVYAPYSDLKLTGNAMLGGHYFVKTAAVSGTGNLLQSGEALPVAAAPTGGGPKTKAAAMPGSRVGVLAGPDPEFKLGEVYVFPNPAKGTEAPVFHIETGLADSVKIAIYTISGRVAYEHTLTGLPAELDDGNGLSYAYEYTWRGHIPSGVYLYYIEVRKAGQTLKKTGKFSVIR